MITLMASINDSIANILLEGILAALIGYLLKRLHQPYLIGYIIIGVCLGRYGFDVFRSMTNEILTTNPKLMSANQSV